MSGVHPGDGANRVPTGRGPACESRITFFGPGNDRAPASVFAEATAFAQHVLRLWASPNRIGRSI